MRFEIHHELDAPLDLVERALMSPELGPRLGRGVADIESIEALAHQLDGDRFRRIWRFQARAPLALLRGHRVTREMMTWDEHSEYRRAERRGEWHVVPRAGQDVDGAWRARFEARGSYRLEGRGSRTWRTVRGDIAVRLGAVGGLVERAAISKLREAYAAEAAALLGLCP